MPCRAMANNHLGFVAKRAYVLSYHSVSGWGFCVCSPHAWHDPGRPKPRTSMPPQPQVNCFVASLVRDAYRSETNPNSTVVARAGVHAGRAREGMFDSAAVGQCEAHNAISPLNDNYFIPSPGPHTGTVMLTTTTTHEPSTIHVVADERADEATTDPYAPWVAGSQQDGPGDFRRPIPTSSSTPAPAPQTAPPAPPSSSPSTATVAKEGIVHYSIARGV